MPTSFHSLPVTEAISVQGIVYPEPDKHLALEDPATLVMVDFLKERPLVIDGGLSLAAAKGFMKSAHVSLKLVINTDNEFIGIVTLKNILGKKALAKAHDMGIELCEIKVQDIMEPVSALVSIHADTLKHAKIGDVLQTFSRTGVEYVLVIQDDESHPGKTKLRGIIAATKVAQGLNISLVSSERARSFSDIVHAVQGHFA